MRTALLRKRNDLTARRSLLLDQGRAAVMSDAPADQKERERSKKQGEEGEAKAAAKKPTDDAQSVVDAKSGAAEGNGNDEGDQGIPEDSWFYLDPSQQAQGPFTWDQMNAWFKAGYLKPDLPVLI